MLLVNYKKIKNQPRYKVEIIDMKRSMEEERTVKFTKAGLEKVLTPIKHRSHIDYMVVETFNFEGTMKEMLLWHQAGVIFNEVAF